MAITTFLNTFTKLWRNSFIRYAISGVLTVLTDVLVLVLLKEFAHVDVYLAATISFGASLLVNFLLNKYWAFGVRSYTSQQIVMYGILVSINYAVGLGLIGFAMNSGGSYVIGKISALVLTTLWNFFIYKYIIFAPTSVMHRILSKKDSSTDG